MYIYIAMTDDSKIGVLNSQQFLFANRWAGIEANHSINLEILTKTNKIKLSINN